MEVKSLPTYDVPSRPGYLSQPCSLFPFSILPPPPSPVVMQEAQERVDDTVPIQHLLQTFLSGVLNPGRDGWGGEQRGRSVRTTLASAS